ncbi:MAG: glycosyltransferase family 2 protein [Patescibacteria group bacterium]|nr:glycosyltransferase family 2 protein [Patescibacteria group bacterium]
MQSPLVSIVIATYNSAGTLELVLQSIKKQKYKPIDIIVLDGGFTDETLQIAREYKCRIYQNKRVQPTYAKHVGFLEAKGKYVVFLDSDEVLGSVDSIKKKVSCLEREKDVVAVTPVGYKDPKNYPFINRYINEFGDPFSFFIYRLSKNHKYYLRSMISRYLVVKKTKDYVVFDLSQDNNLPIIELAAMGSMLDKSFFLTKCPEVTKVPELIWHTFYLLNKNQKLIAIAKDDPIFHYSATSLKRYLRKINWRIILNVYLQKDHALAGFSGRNNYQKGFYSFKKYLFLPYVFLLLPVLFDSLYLSFTRRNFCYLIHLILSFWTAFLITYHFVRKQFGLSYKLPTYGD